MLIFKPTAKIAKGKENADFVSLSLSQSSCRTQVNPLGATDAPQLEPKLRVAHHLQVPGDPPPHKSSGGQDYAALLFLDLRR